MSDKTRPVSEIWYKTYWKDRETLKFKKWFLEYFGSFSDQEENDRKEYYTHRAFALMGWLGKSGELE